MHKIVKHIAVLITVLVLVFSFSSCSKSKSITIGIEDNTMPLSGTNSDDEIDGYIVELAREASKRMGKDVEFKFVDMQKGSENFSTENVDALWGRITDSDENSNTMNFTRHYLKDNQIILVLNGSLIEDVSDLKDKKIGTVRTSVKAMDDAQTEFTSKIEGAAVQKYSEAVTAKIQLDNSSVDAIIVEESFARYVLTQHSEQYRVLDGTISENSYSVAVRRNDSQLRDDFEVAIDSMINDGTAKSISKKWFSIDMTAYD